MKINWKYWVLIISIIIVIALIFYGLLFGFRGEGSKIVDGSFKAESPIGKGVGFIDDLRGEEDFKRERDLGKLIAKDE